ncbi:MAG: replication-associated recombination protein A, partial [Candidatus Roizmanbacteria bacterium]|nr:replication-associated recombination protein A [Candidatus Roizmanbacteria bacterium]
METQVSASNAASPLADRMRPQSLEEFVGQRHLVGEGKILRTIIAQDTIPSMIFWGPPGSGKTTLARIIANETDSEFIQISAVLSGVQDIRDTVKRAKETRQMFEHKRTILFIDEIHRFNKAQQDSLLPHVEDGTVILIGATTENPSFEVIGALLSRTRVFTLEQLSTDDILIVLDSTLSDKKRGLGSYKIKLGDKEKHIIAEFANGDARTALNVLEIAQQITPKKTKKTIVIDKNTVLQAIQQSNLYFDKSGEEHYNTISAFIKSMRAGNADAAVYYLARMVESGEDPLFIARRMVIFASEDIGMAVPTALVVANEVFKSCEVIGYPECAINLAHGVVYLASCKKDRRAYNALRAAQADVKQFGNLPIPLHLRNAPTKLMKELGYGEGYEKYPEKGKNLLPDKLRGK